MHHHVVPLPAKNKDPVRRMGKYRTISNEEEPSLDQIWISSSFKVRRVLDSVWAHRCLNPNLKSVRVSGTIDHCETAVLKGGKKQRKIRTGMNVCEK